MKILLTGASGSIGEGLFRFLVSMRHEVMPVDLVDCNRIDGVIIADLRDPVRTRDVFDTCQPDVLLHLAAITDLQYCEKEREISHSVNFTATEVLVRLCREKGVRLVYLSSDYVFGKRDALWEVDDEPCPVNQYGRDKARSESIIMDNLDDYAIVRTAQLYGFDGDFVRLVLRTLAKGQAFEAFDNLVNCPTWTVDLFRMLTAIIKDDHRGVFHCVGMEAVSRFRYARAIAGAFGLPCELVVPAFLDFSLDIRPSVVRLDGRSTCRRLGVHPGSLKANLQRYRVESDLA